MLVCVHACVHVGASKNVLCCAGVDIPGLRSESQGERNPVRYGSRGARSSRKDKGVEGDSAEVRVQAGVVEDKEDQPEGEWTHEYTYAGV